MPDKKTQIEFSNIKNALSYNLSIVTRINDDSIDLSKNSLIVVTAAGTIYGTVVSDLPDDNIADRFLSIPFEQALKETKPGVSNYCLILKDATLISGQGVRQFFKTLFVFPEDIIAITIGDASNNF